MRSLQRFAKSSSRFHLYDVPIDRITQSESVCRVADWIEHRDTARLILTPDTTALMRARWDASLKTAYQSADLVTADGTGLVWASQLFGAPVAERVTGIDLMEALCRQAARLDHRIFLLGAKPGVAEQAQQVLQKKYPSLEIVGTHHGYFELGDDDRLIETINGSNPDILFVGLGVPLQERWLLRNRSMMRVPVLMGVGGSFDVIAGRVARAPLFWQHSGCEWLWRALQEPARLSRVKVIPIFLLQLLFYKFLGWALNSV